MIDKLFKEFVFLKDKLGKKYEVSDGILKFKLIFCLIVDYKDVLLDFEYVYEFMVIVRLEGYIRK